MESMQGYAVSFMGAEVQGVISHYRVDGRITEKNASFFEKVEQYLDGLILAARFFEKPQVGIGFSLEDISDLCFVSKAIKGQEEALGIGINYYSDLITYFQLILEVIRELQASSPEVSDEEAEKAYIFFENLAKYAIRFVEIAQMSLAVADDM